MRLPPVDYSNSPTDWLLLLSYFRQGIQILFDSLIGVIVEKKDAIEQENELKKRDSVFLSNPPAWDAQAEEEEAREKAASGRSGAWSCCST